MRMASEAKYDRAMRALTDKLLADLQDPDKHSALGALHPSPGAPTQPFMPTDLPLAPDITEEQVLRAAHSLNPSSAAGPDLISSGLLQLLARTSVSPGASITGLSFLARLV